MGEHVEIRGERVRLWPQCCTASVSLSGAVPVGGVQSEPQRAAERRSRPWESVPALGSGRIPFIMRPTPPVARARLRTKNCQGPDVRRLALAGVLAHHPRSPNDLAAPPLPRRTSKAVAPLSCVEWDAARGTE
ncbi:unnamed protein product [Gadus morhua 'NCC']